MVPTVKVRHESLRVIRTFSLLTLDPSFSTVQNMEKEKGTSCLSVCLAASSPSSRTVAWIGRIFSSFRTIASCQALPRFAG
jgi:hypothetical protein